MTRLRPQRGQKRYFFVLAKDFLYAYKELVCDIFRTLNGIAFYVNKRVELEKGSGLESRDFIDAIELNFNFSFTKKPYYLN